MNSFRSSSLNSRRFSYLAIVGALLAAPASRLAAAPVAGQIVPVAVYTGTTSSFGLTYDSNTASTAGAFNGAGLIHWTQGDSGDSAVHTLKPFKNFTAGEKAGLPTSGGLYLIDNTAGLVDVAGTTSPTGGAHFASLGYDASSRQLVVQANGDSNSLNSFDPFTGANFNTNYRPGTSVNSFADGLDVDGGDVWYSPDVGSIYKNGTLWASNVDAADVTLPGWSGQGSTVGLGWSGVEQVGGSVFAVAVHSNSDTGRSRTLVKFDTATAELVGYDPDGDDAAARWEDLAYDGQYLYAADLRGTEFDRAPGAIWVFEVTGGLSIPTGDPAVPEGGTVAAGIFLGGLVVWRACRRGRQVQPA